MRRLALVLALVLALAVAADVLAGGISDETCPNARGENTNTCPPGTVGMPYSIRFVESEGSGCGPGRQTFHLDSGVLPPGLTLAPDGTLSGTSTLAGSFQFYVELREPADDPANCAGKRTQKQFTLKIRRQPRIVATPAVPPRSEVGVPYGITLRARGGSGIFAWALAAGKLPEGLRLRADGSITGTPRVAGTYYVEVKARDTESRSLTWATTLSVAPRLVIRTQRVPGARVGRFYSADLRAVGGVAPRVWRLTHGRLPRGLRLASALGRFTGTPEETGRHLVTVEVSDGLEVEHTKSFRIVVLGARAERGATSRKHERRARTRALAHPNSAS
ncbi:MAG: putative Ig domain-containing protein [Actinobacteria bacterium]|nr:putative Ig domain-containing protein [Actinomycetota bacterium]